MPRRRFQTGRVVKRGKKWIGMYRDNEVSPQTGQRIRHRCVEAGAIVDEDQHCRPHAGNFSCTSTTLTLNLHRLGEAEKQFPTSSKNGNKP